MHAHFSLHAACQSALVTRISHLFLASQKNDERRSRPDEDAVGDSALANSAVAAFYQIEAPGKHLLAKFGTKYCVGAIVAANLGKESTNSTECNSTYCFLDAPLFAGAMRQEAARASPFMTELR